MPKKTFGIQDRLTYILAWRGISNALFIVGNILNRIQNQLKKIKTVAE